MAIKCGSPPSKLPAVAAVFALLISGCEEATNFSAGSTKGRLTVAVDLPLSGDAASVGVPMLNGIKFAVQQQGAIDGYTIQVKAFDDAVGGRPNSQKGASNIAAMLKDDSIVAMVGPSDSAVARVEIPIANAAHLVMVSPANSDPCLTRNVYLSAASGISADVTCKEAGLASANDLRPAGPNNYFRVVATDDLQGPAAADFLHDTLGLNWIGVASDGEPYGRSIADAFSSRFTHDGGHLIGTRLDFDPRQISDFRPWLAQEFAHGAEGIYYGGLAENKGCLIRSQMQGLVKSPAYVPFMGGQAIVGDPTCMSDAGQWAVGIYGSVTGEDPQNSRRPTPAIAAFKRAYPSPADYSRYTIPAYDSAGVIMAAIRSVLDRNNGRWPSSGNAAREPVRAAVASTTDYPGAIGNFSFDANGDTSLKIVSIYQDTSTDPNASWAFVTPIDLSPQVAAASPTPAWGACPSADDLSSGLGSQVAPLSKRFPSSGTCQYQAGMADPNDLTVRLVFANGQDFTSFVSMMKAAYLPPPPDASLQYADVSGVGSNAILFQSGDHDVTGLIAALGTRDLFIWVGGRTLPATARVEALANQLLQRSA